MTVITSSHRWWNNIFHSLWTCHRPISLTGEMYILPAKPNGGHYSYITGQTNKYRSLFMFTSSCRTFTKATDTQTALTRDTSEFKQWTCCEDKGHGDSKSVVPLVCPGKYVFCWQKLIAIATGNLGGMQAEFRFKGARRGTSVKSRQRFSTNTFCSFNFQHSVTVSFIHQEAQRWQVVKVEALISLEMESELREMRLRNKTLFSERMKLLVRCREKKRMFWRKNKTKLQTKNMLARELCNWSIHQESSLWQKALI